MEDVEEEAGRSNEEAVDEEGRSELIAEKLERFESTVERWFKASSFAARLLQSILVSRFVSVGIEHR